MSKGWRITAPASSANLGPGFDSIGIALAKYLTIEVTIADEWSFTHHSPALQGLPEGKAHLIYYIAEQVADRYQVVLPACAVSLESDIPLARGLGSSAAAIAVAIELVNSVCDLSLTENEKLLLGTEFEGHPDNIGASLVGGIVIGMFDQPSLDIVQIPAIDVDIVVSIPAYELKTEDARRVLPERLLYSQAIKGSAVSNVFIAALLTGDYTLAGEVMEKDIFHEPFRTSLIEQFAAVRATAKDNGAFGTVISGAGPTMLTLTKKGSGETLASVMKEAFPDFQIEVLAVDKSGTVVEELVNPIINEE